mmetsp:Transcript_17466/g.46554  ORF Transcript_17466/g.46554 Transcript_17466/m.46554 type:complete len:464 (-) Transcript_17466:64-1455(-)
MLAERSVPIHQHLPLTLQPLDLLHHPPLKLLLLHRHPRPAIPRVIELSERKGVELEEGRGARGGGGGCGGHGGGGGDAAHELDGVVDEELAPDHARDVEEPRFEAEEEPARAEDAGDAGDLEERGVVGLLLLLVDFGEDRVARLGGDRGREAGEEAGEGGDEGGGAGGDLAAVAEESDLHHELDEDHGVFEGDELRHRVGDLLQQNRRESLEEPVQPLALVQVFDARHDVARKVGVRDGANANGFERAQKRARDALRQEPRRRGDVERGLPHRDFRARRQNDLEHLVKRVLKRAVQKIARRGGAQPLEQGPRALVPHDRAQRVHGPRVLPGTRLQPGLHHVDRGERRVRQQRANPAGEKVLHESHPRQRVRPRGGHQRGMMHQKREERDQRESSSPQRDRQPQQRGVGGGGGAVAGVGGGGGLGEEVGAEDVDGEEQEEEEREEARGHEEGRETGVTQGAGEG